MAVVQQLFAVVLFFVVITVSLGGILKKYEAVMKQQSLELGLYNSSDKVVILSNVNLKEIVLQQNHSSLVEFYNSYCGHCKRFAPTYKKLADELYPWRSVLRICAIDCAAEENNEICREYEIMAYPTMRYIGPHFTAGPQNYGTPLETQNLSEIKNNLAQWLVAENRTANITNWPNFQHVTESDVDTLFEGLGSQKEYVIVVYEPENSTIGVETILNFQRWSNVQVRRVTDNEIAAKLKIDSAKYKIATIDRKGNIVPYTSLADTSKAYTETISSFLNAQHFTELPEVVSSTAANLLLLAERQHENEEIVKEVKKNKHLVYQADLEMAIRGTIFNEVSKVGEISNDRLLALQRFLAVLNRYNPLGANGKIFITKLYEYVMQFNQQLSGKDFENEVTKLESQYKPIFSANHYVGCTGSQPSTRGFTCSVWQLFHYLTVQAARTEISQDPLEILQAMHGYIKHFFGCTNCAEHFQAMATKRKIWSTPNKDDAVLWLWAAHNEVNNRLAGDSTEDPLFPKIQFPSQSSCSGCYKQPISPATMETNWDKNAVLSFLKNIHNPEYISRYGVEHEELLQPTIEKLRQKRMIGNVFSDMDMRMGMLLYVFCIGMMVIAFKLFAFKGYRKKPYGHDLLGKV
ncbi:sulfhydryl oxidase 1-like [Teleopsis dalmanni]|uniref:sulfhydryl oxidase 1-like n=1 Tax=Teleopsis dalmanni TaxID=139649 RepID=UPI0018CDE5AE|nr:sulfhydryl oxidase 1-like [Teleopsis dalmanni]